MNPIMTKAVIYGNKVDVYDYFNVLDKRKNQTWISKKEKLEDFTVVLEKEIINNFNLYEDVYIQLDYNCYLTGYDAVILKNELNKFIRKLTKLTGKVEYLAILEPETECDPDETITSITIHLLLKQPIYYFLTNNQSNNNNSPIHEDDELVDEYQVLSTIWFDSVLYVNPLTTEDIQDLMRIMKLNNDQGFYHSLIKSKGLKSPTILLADDANKFIQHNDLANCHINYSEEYFDDDYGRVLHVQYEQELLD